MRVGEDDLYVLFFSVVCVAKEICGDVCREGKRSPVPEPSRLAGPTASSWTTQRRPVAKPSKPWTW